MEFHILSAGGVEAIPETWSPSVGHSDAAYEMLDHNEWRI